MREVPLVVYVGPDRERRVIGSATVSQNSDGDWIASGRVTEPKDFPGYEKFMEGMQFSLEPSAPKVDVNNLPMPKPVYHNEPWVFVGGTASFVVPDLEEMRALEMAARYAAQMLWLESNNYNALEKNFGNACHDTAYYDIRGAWARYKAQFDDTPLKDAVQEAFDSIYNPIIDRMEYRL